MKQIVKILPLIIPLFASGCFSAASRTDWGGGKRTPTTGQAVEAAALDIVTLPIQAIVLPPAYVSAKSDEAKRERMAKEYRQLMTLLESNATVAIQERWDLKKDQHHQVFIDSFSNPKVKYTQSELNEIHKTCPDVRDYVFRSQFCSQEYLVGHFDEEFERAKNPTNQTGLAAIVSNTNTPIDLVERVASNKEFASGVKLPAEQALSQRSSKGWMEMLEKDPSIALQERWGIKNRSRQFTFQRSFSNSKIKYSPDLLEAIYETCPSMQDYVFYSPYCSRDFLNKHFDEAFEQGQKWPLQNQQRLHAIFKNPNCPIELVEKVAFATNYPGGATMNAKFVLKQRQSEIQTH